MATTIDLRGLVRPQLVEATKREDNPNVAEFRLQPLERGFGHTLGNAMRRLLLSSLRGSAVWGFRIDGVVHEHQTIPGVVEDVHQIIGNLKTLTLTLDEDVETAVLRIQKGEAGPITAGDIQPSSGVRIVEGAHHLLTLQEDRELNIELYVNKGRGYVESDQHPVDRGLPVDLVRVDSIYNPVRRANFAVAETRVGQRTDYDRLTLTVETNGTVTPEEAVSYAAALAQTLRPACRPAATATAPTPRGWATCSARRSTTSSSRCAASTRSRTRTSARSVIWCVRPRTRSCRSRTSARSPSRRSPISSSARG
jgi:DNA-directed RNA polymerase subunit alpha